MGKIGKCWKLLGEKMNSFPCMRFVNISVVRVVATNPDNFQKVQESLKGRPGVKILVVGEAGDERRGGGGNVMTFHEVCNTAGGANLPPMAHPDNMFLLPFSSGRQLTINNQLLTITNDKCNVHITLHHIVPPLCGRETFGNYSGIFRKTGNYVKGDNYIRLLDYSEQ